MFSFMSRERQTRGGKRKGGGGNPIYDYFVHSFVRFFFHFIITMIATIIYDFNAYVRFVPHSYCNYSFVYSVFGPLFSFLVVIRQHSYQSEHVSKKVNEEIERFFKGYAGDF